MKKILALVLACVMVLALCACGGGGAKEVDLDALAAELLASGGFTDTLSQPAEGVAQRLYDFEEGDVKKVLLYTGTGATAEEIFLAEATGADAAKTLKSACETRAENQKRAFENYAPGEVEKLNDAVILTAGNYVVMAVSADAGAARAAAEGFIGS